jgi:pimeloyl-ACP methyl ester carboxylesterase
VGPPPYIAVDLVEDTVGVLDAHGIEGAQTWGVSLGGMIIPAAADQSP